MLGRFSIENFSLQKIKEENERILQEYGFCIMDNHKERIGNFRIEPPGLFRGRGDHPKMGMLKRRIRPEDVIINCSKWVLHSLTVCMGGRAVTFLPLGGSIHPQWTSVTWL